MLDWNNPETYRVAYKNKLRVPKEVCIENIKKTCQNSFGFIPNIENPKFLSEKLQWLKFNDNNPFLIVAQDKLLSKKYFKHKGIGDSFIPKTLQIVESISSIDLNSLPDKFVIKTNHGAGGNQVLPICDKKELNNKDILSKLSGIWDSLSYPNQGSLCFGEWWYLYIEPKMFIEEFLEHDYLEFDNGKAYRGEFRVYCFHGEPKLFIFNHDPDALIYPNYDNSRCPASYYNKDWKQIYLVKTSKHRKYRDVYDMALIKPNFFDDMCEICRLVSKDFPFMRVDLIPSKEGLKLNELTPSPSTGLFRYDPYPEEIDLILGDLLDLSKVKPYKKNEKS